MNRNDWTKVFSYDADVTMIIGARGIGKTYALREQFIRDWLRDGSRFVAVARYETMIPIIARDYFGALAKPNADGEPTSRLMREHHLIFKKVGYTLQCAEIPADKVNDEKYRVKGSQWDTIGYFVSLSKYQMYKEMTFARVRRILMDEAIIERPSMSNRYLADEYDRLVSIVDSVSREQADSGLHKPNVYLLGNSGSVVNPYFQHFGVDTVPPNGFSWWGGKTFLLYVAENRQYSKDKAEKTVAGRMSRGAKSAEMANDNAFTVDDDTMIVPKKPRGSDFVFGIKCNGYTFGIWSVWNEGFYYVNSYHPRGDVPIYALTTSDNKINYIMADRTQPQMEIIIDCYKSNLLRFDSIATRRNFETYVCALYGLRV